MYTWWGWVSHIALESSKLYCLDKERSREIKIQGLCFFHKLVCHHNSLCNLIRLLNGCWRSEQEWTLWCWSWSSTFLDQCRKCCLGPFGRGEHHWDLWWIYNVWCHRRTWVALCGSANGRSFKYKINRIGPRYSLPWGHQTRKAGALNFTCWLMCIGVDLWGKHGTISKYYLRNQITWVCEEVHCVAHYWKPCGSQGRLHLPGLSCWGRDERLPEKEVAVE